MKKLWVELVAARKLILCMSLFGLVCSVSFSATEAPVAVSIARLQSVVRLVNEGGQTYCSGVIVGKSIVLTAAHCIDEGASEVTIRTQSGKDIVTKVAQVDRRMDRAILLGDFAGLTRAKLDTSPAKIVAGLTSKTRKLYACGYPHGARLYCSRFIPSGRQVFMFKGRGTAVPGMSGGPVLDADTGEVFSVTSQVSDNGEICVAPLIEALSRLYEQTRPQIF